MGSYNVVHVWFLVFGFFGHFLSFPYDFSKIFKCVYLHNHFDWCHDFSYIICTTHVDYPHQRSLKNINVLEKYTNCNFWNVYISGTSEIHNMTLCCGASTTCEYYSYKFSLKNIDVLWRKVILNFCDFLCFTFWGVFKIHIDFNKNDTHIINLHSNPNLLNGIYVPFAQLIGDLCFSEVDQFFNVFFFEVIFLPNTSIFFHNFLHS